jgi:hypothetical protein
MVDEFAADAGEFGAFLVAADERRAGPFRFSDVFGDDAMARHDGHHAVEGMRD